MMPTGSPSVAVAIVARRPVLPRYRLISEELYSANVNAHMPVSPFELLIVFVDE